MLNICFPKTLPRDVVKGLSQNDFMEIVSDSPFSSIIGAMAGTGESVYVVFRITAMFPGALIRVEVVHCTKLLLRNVCGLVCQVSGAVLC